MLRLAIAAALLVFAACPAVSQAKPKTVKTSGVEVKVEHVLLGDVDEDSANETATAVEKAVSAGASYVFIHINSFGGSVFAGMDLIGRIDRAKEATGAKTICVVEHRAISMGFVFLQSSACDMRIARRGSILLDHKASGRIQGTVEEMEEQIAVLRAINRAMSEIICARLGLTYEQHEAMVDGRDWVMSSYEALAVNAVDRVVD